MNEPATGTEAAQCRALPAWIRPLAQRRAPFVELGLVLAVCLVLYLPGRTALPPIDRDEARFAEAARRMADSPSWSDWLIPQIQERPRLGKPPLIYWLQAGMARAAPAAPCSSGGLPSGGIAAYRWPSLLGALVAVAATWALARSMFGSPAALAALLLGTCVVVMVDVRQARADQVLLACTTTAHAALWYIWRQPRTRGVLMPLVLWTSIALGMLTKGPITPALVGCTSAALCIVTRDVRWLGRTRPLLGMILVAALILPWPLAVAQSIGWRPFLATLHDEVIGRSVSSKEGHGGLPGYHLLLLPILLWPGSLALVPALTRAVRRGIRFAPGAPAGWLAGLAHAWRTRAAGRPAELFCLAWLVPGWLVFELLATRLPHYTLPLFPPLALLSARAVYSRPAWTELLGTATGRLLLGGWVVLSVLVMLAAPASVMVLGQWHAEGRTLFITALVGLLLVVLAAALVATAARRHMVRLQWLALVCGAGLTVLAFELVLPHLQVLWTSARVVAAVRQVDPQGVRPLATVGYDEDSLVFLTSGRIARLNWRQIEPWLAEHPDGLAVLAKANYVDTRALVPLATVRGFNYSNGRWVELLLINAGQGGQVLPRASVPLQ